MVGKNRLTEAARAKDNDVLLDLYRCDLSSWLGTS